MELTGKSWMKNTNDIFAVESGPKRKKWSKRDRNIFAKLRNEHVD